MKLFEVEAKCGHVGRKYFTLKVFPVKANSRKEAAAIVRNIPRVKHHHKDAILVSKKPIEASKQELAENKRSSSAKLRVLEKL